MPHSEITLLARDACIDLFASYGVVLVADEDDPKPVSSACGIIGFTGDAIQGCLVLAASQDVLQASYPLPGHAGNDWIAELANQHVGRLKTRLLDHGVTIVITTPLVLSGVGIVPMGDRLSRFAFSAGPESPEAVRMWLDVHVTGDFVLGEVTPGAGLAEGAALLFTTPFPEELTRLRRRTHLTVMVPRTSL